jgi:cation transport regulator ChaC
MTRIAVFGYGSLADPASAARTLGRPVPAPAVRRLPGWRRRWSIARDNLRLEKTFALAGGDLPPWILGLSVEQNAEPEDEPVNGVLVEVSEAELDRLDVREIRYDRLDVTGQVEGADGFDRVVIYVGKREVHVPRPPEGAVVMRSYVDLVEHAFDALGPGELEAFWRSTDTPPVDVVEATLVRDEIPPGNPRDW